MNIKVTVDNVLHANENALAKKRAEDRAKRNAIIGASTTAGVGLTGFITTKIWKRRYVFVSKKYHALDDRMARMESLLDQYEAELTKLKEEKNND